MAWWKDEVCKVYALKTFPKLAQAKEYLAVENIKRERTGKPPSKIWSREVTSSGARYFLVEDPNVF